jgi:hypothetical protein
MRITRERQGRPDRSRAGGSSRNLPIRTGDDNPRKGKPDRSHVGDRRPPNRIQTLKIRKDELRATDAGLDMIQSADVAAQRTLLEYPSTDSGKGASLVGVEDSGEAFTGTTVEVVLTELNTSVVSKQPSDATLTALASTGIGSDEMLYGTGSDTFAKASLTAFGRSLVDDASSSAARTTLGLVIGTDVQAYHASLAALASTTAAANKLAYFDSADPTMATTDLTSFARTVLDDANAATARTTLGVAIGSDVQAADATLTSLAALADDADSIPYQSSGGVFSNADISAQGRSLIAAATAAAAQLVLKPIHRLTIHADGNSNCSQANAPNSLIYFENNRTATKTDLANYSEVRLILRVVSISASSNSPRCIALYKTGSYSSTIGNYSAIGTSEVSVALSGYGVISSAWIALAAGAKADDIQIAIGVDGGDGVADPAIGNLSLEFR